MRGGYIGHIYAKGQLFQPLKLDEKGQLGDTLHSVYYTSVTFTPTYRCKLLVDLAAKIFQSCVQIFQLDTPIFG